VLVQVNRVVSGIQLALGLQLHCNLSELRLGISQRYLVLVGIIQQRVLALHLKFMQLDRALDVQPLLFVLNLTAFQSVRSLGDLLFRLRGLLVGLLFHHTQLQRGVRRDLGGSDRWGFWGRRSVDARLIFLGVHDVVRVEVLRLQEQFGPFFRVNPVSRRCRHVAHLCDGLVLDGPLNQRD
jgi:hypothetical protein